jgi:hypothetical protein
VFEFKPPLAVWQALTNACADAKMFGYCWHLFEAVG